MNRIVIEEEASGLRAAATLLDDKAPAVTAFVRRWLAEPRRTESIHAMWSGPEISSAIASGDLPDDNREPPPPQNVTLNPLAGELVFLHFAERLWDGGAAAIFDIGLFYGDRARLLFPVGWVAGSVFARIPADEMAAVAAACARIRRSGQASLHWSLI